MIKTLKIFYKYNKLYFVITVILLLVFLVGCAKSSNSGYAPAGPIGGGCGG